MVTSALHKSPFALLEVTSRDDRRRIVEQAEERSLELSHDDCQKARSDLTNPRNRLTAEVAWLPGVSPRRASQLMSSLLIDANSVRFEKNLPTLARCNLLAAAFESVGTNDSAASVAAFIQELAQLAEELETNEVLRDINEDRTISGFPEVKATDQLEAELSDRKRYFKASIKEALNRLPPACLLDAMTLAVDGATINGEEHAPELIDELVDTYAVEVQSILEQEGEKVETLIRSIRASFAAGDAVVVPLVERLEKVTRNWDRFAQPIQLSAKARGIDHDASKRLAYAIRSLAVDLFNDHQMLVLSQRLMQLLKDLFSELPEVSERVDSDATTLADIAARRVQDKSRSKQEEEEWAREITFSADVGLVFKDALRISPEGIEWKGTRSPLGSITAVRWGSTRHSVNGIPTGTDYQISFATRSGATVVSLKKESTFTGFLNAVWRAVGVRLMIEMSEALKEGASLAFGDITIEDTHVTLVRRKFLASNERVRLSWSDVHVWSANGEFFVGSKNDKKTYSSASYMNVWNTHLLDHLIRAGFKKGVAKVSDYFGD